MTLIRGWLSPLVWVDCRRRQNHLAEIAASNSKFSTLRGPGLSGDLPALQRLQQAERFNLDAKRDRNVLPGGGG